MMGTEAKTSMKKRIQCRFNARIKCALIPGLTFKKYHKTEQFRETKAVFEN